MGDDGYALAGVAYQIAGNDSLAQNAWKTQVQEYPNGDRYGTVVNHTEKQR